MKLIDAEKLLSKMRAITEHGMSDGVKTGDNWINIDEFTWLKYCGDCTLSPSDLLAVTKELTEIRKMQEKAKAWEILAHPGSWVNSRKQKQTEELMGRCLAQARRELDKKGGVLL